MSSGPNHVLHRQLLHGEDFLETLSMIVAPEIPLNPPISLGTARGVTIGDADMALRIGERQEFSGVANRTGHLHLVNLGTDGCVYILLRGDGPHAAIRKGESFRLPSVPFFPSDMDLIVAPPRTSLPNQLDTMLVVITDDPAHFTVTQLYPHFLPGPPSGTPRQAAPPAGRFGKGTSPGTLVNLLTAGQASYGFLRFQIL